MFGLGTFDHDEGTTRRGGTVDGNGCDGAWATAWPPPVGGPLGGGAAPAVPAANPVPATVTSAATSTPTDLLRSDSPMSRPPAFPGRTPPPGETHGSWPPCGFIGAGPDSPEYLTLILQPVGLCSAQCGLRLPGCNIRVRVGTPLSRRGEGARPVRTPGEATRQDDRWCSRVGLAQSEERRPAMRSSWPRRRPRRPSPWHRPGVSPWHRAPVRVSAFPTITSIDLT